MLPDNPLYQVLMSLGLGTVQEIGCSSHIAKGCFAAKREGECQPEMCACGKDLCHE